MNFAIFGLGFVGLFLIGFPLSLSALDMTGYFGGLGGTVGSPLIGDGNWIVLFNGGRALSSGGIYAGVLALFTYMVAFPALLATTPTGSMAERRNWGQLRHPGHRLRRPTARCSRRRRGRRLACEDVGTMGLGAGYVDFAGSGAVHAVGGAAAPESSCSASHRQLRT